MTPSRCTPILAPLTVFWVLGPQSSIFYGEKTNLDKPHIVAMDEHRYIFAQEEMGRAFERWDLIPDGEPFSTPAGLLQPVYFRGVPAMLKVAVEAEEKWGAVLMEWWNGEGAARVLGHEGDALLLERAQGKRALAEIVHSGNDDEASRIICAVAAKLHAPRIGQAPPPLIPLQQWFEELEPAAKRYGGILKESASTARELLAFPQEITVLHGDLHHGNILDFGECGWLAIDPKCLVGERGFDFANIFCNPDAEIACVPHRLARQATIVAEAANLERERLLQWVLAYAGLSAAWTLADGEDADLALTVAHIAVGELSNP